MQKNKDIEKVVVKARYWSLIVYPESAPADWKDKIQMSGLPFVISPLHDKDTNPDGTPKKPHYHVIVCYNGPTTFSNVKKTLTDPLNQPHPQYLQSVKGMYRYLTHKDNPEKFQYNEKEIQVLNGFTIQDYADLSITDEDRLFDAIENEIFSNGIREYFELCMHLKTNGLPELLSFMRRHTYHFKELLASLRHSGYFEATLKIDDETGEVLNDNDSAE